jgi:hypothetical protein
VLGGLALSSEGQTLTDLARSAQSLLVRTKADRPAGVQPVTDSTLQQ